MPRGVYERRKHSEVVAERISGVRREAVRHRWESVKEEQEKWIKPFNDEPVEVALRYLEDLRTICERGSNILNARINDNANIKCAGPRCGKDLTGTRPNGMPKWIAKMDLKDKQEPNIFHCLYFCCPLCQQEWARKNMNNALSDGK